MSYNEIRTDGFNEQNLPPSPNSPLYLNNDIYAVEYNPENGGVRLRPKRAFGSTTITPIVWEDGEWTEKGERIVLPNLSDAQKTNWENTIKKSVENAVEDTNGVLPSYYEPQLSNIPPSAGPIDNPNYEGNVGVGTTVPTGFGTNDPTVYNSDGTQMGDGNVTSLQDQFKGLRKSDSILQRLSLKNLKYPVDADYGNSQDYIQINQFTYKAPNPSVLFPRQGGVTSTYKGLDFDDPDSFEKGLLPGRGGGGLIPGYGAQAQSTLLNGLSSQSPKEVPIGSVKLPMPNQLNDSNNVAWGEDQLNALTAAAATLASGGLQETIDFIRDASSGKLGNGFDIIAEIFKGAGDKGRSVANFLQQASKNPNAQLNARSVVGSSLLNLVGFGVSPEAILARGAGVVPNSNLQLLFNAPALRAFRFDWKMSPRSRDEATRVNNIIRFFKQGMAVKKMGTDSPGGSAYFLGTPNVFDIEFRTSKSNREITNTNHSVLKIKTCACVGAAVNYTPEGMWNAYEKGQPTSCILSLQFKELEPIFNTDYDEDPFNYDNLTGYIPSNAVGY